MIKKLSVSVIICVCFMPFAFSEGERLLISEDLILIADMYENCNNSLEAIQYLELVKENTPYNFYANRKFDYLICEVLRTKCKKCCLQQN